jgi:hypothetical protein
MKIKTNIEVIPEEVAEMLCGTSTINELLDLIKFIAENVDDYDFDKKLSTHFTDIVSYVDAEQKSMVED